MSGIRFELIMDAGNGAQKAGDILIKAFAKNGLFVFIEPIIPAEISPPKRTQGSMSGVVIRLSDHEVTNIGSYSDFMIIEHEILLNRRLDDREFNPEATLLVDMGDEPRAKEAYSAAIQRAKQEGLNVIPFDIDPDSQAIIGELKGNGKNMFYLGILAYVFGVDRSLMETLIRQMFSKLSSDRLEKNIQIYLNAFDYAGTLGLSVYSLPIHLVEGDKILMDGNTALANGIIDSGIKLYSGYPITPASTIMHTLARLFPSYGGILHQAEDEISAIGAVIGSYYAGVPAITATAGPGFSLKQEFIGFSMVSEIPCIVVDVQRGGPSTGLPTRTEQSDLFAAIFGAHGDNTKIVISVANVEDCFYAPHVARYLTETLRVPVIILSDYITSVSYRVLDRFELAQMDRAEDIPDSILAHFRLKRLEMPVGMVKSNQSTPGELDKMRRVTGLNTDVNGQVTYTAQSNKRSHEIRNQKIHAVKDVLLKPEMFGDSEGDVLVVGWGSARGALLESVESLRASGYKVSGLHLKIVWPLPAMLSDIFKQFKRVVTIEVAYGDSRKMPPLAMILRSETLVDVRAAVAEANGQPLKPKQVISRVEAMVNG